MCMNNTRGHLAEPELFFYILLPCRSMLQPPISKESLSTATPASGTAYVALSYCGNMFKD